MGASWSSMLRKNLQPWNSMNRKMITAKGNSVYVVTNPETWMSLTVKCEKCKWDDFIERDQEPIWTQSTEQVPVELCDSSLRENEMGGKWPVSLLKFTRCFSFLCFAVRPGWCLELTGHSVPVLDRKGFGALLVGSGKCSCNKGRHHEKQHLGTVYFPEIAAILSGSKSGFNLSRRNEE